MKSKRIRFFENRPATRLKGFTLIELIAGAVITMMIMFSITSSIIIATRALPGAASPANTVIIASEAAEKIAAELQYATSIESRSATMIEFQVADRNGDDVPETIRYEWSGTPGAPLTRRYNSGSVVNVLGAVQQFNLSYDTETISQEVTSPNESGEILLSSYNSTENLCDYTMQYEKWYGQYFYPTLPAGTISWKVTRVEFYAKINNSPTGMCRVQLQLPADTKYPSGYVLEDKELYEWTLDVPYLKQQFSFSSVSNLSPSKGLCLVFKWIYGTYACDIRGRNGGAGTSNSFALKSINQGDSWSAPTGQSLLYAVYGTVTTVGTPQIQQVHYLKSVEIKLAADSEERTSVITRAKTLNRPEVVE